MARVTAVFDDRTQAERAESRGQLCAAKDATGADETSCGSVVNDPGMPRWAKHPRSSFTSRVRRIAWEPSLESGRRVANPHCPRVRVEDRSSIENARIPRVRDSRISPYRA